MTTDELAAIRERLNKYGEEVTFSAETIRGLLAAIADRDATAAKSDRNERDVGCCRSVRGPRLRRGCVMEVEAIIYVDECGTIAMDIWNKGYGPLAVPLYHARGYKTVGNATRAYKAVARNRGWNVVNVDVAVDE